MPSIFLPDGFCISNLKAEQMPRTLAEDDDEWEDEPDDDGDDTNPCPYCKKDVYEGAEQCPSCGNYLSEEDARSAPTWIIVGGLICLVIVIFWVRG